MELKDISGVGSQTIKYLNNNNIHTILDLVEYYPINYYEYQETQNSDDKSEFLNNFKNQSKFINILIKGTITRDISEFRPRPNLCISTYFVYDGKNEYKIVCWNQRHLRFTLKKNDTVEIIGKYNTLKKEITQKEVKKIEVIYKNNEIQSNDENEKDIFIKPVYSKITGLPNKKINIIILKALEQLPSNNKYKALKVIHAPKDFEKLKKAQRELKYLEFFEYYSKLQKIKDIQNLEKDEYQKKFTNTSLSTFLYKLPFALTTDQEKVVFNIVDILKSKTKLQSLVLGEVGSGKTIIAIIIAKLVVEAGYQVAMMAPTEILARQLYFSFKNFLPDLKIELLTGSTKAFDKNKIKEYTKLGLVDIVIGTHTLTYDDLQFSNLGLAIIDEQHRFGVEQRNDLIKKSQYKEFIYLCATPIPRTLAQSIFGAMDVQTIESKPKNRKHIITKIYQKNNRKEMFEIIESELIKKNQIYIVAPTIEETEIEKLENVENIYSKMNEYYSGKYKIGLLHGAMKSNDKTVIMDKFKNFEYDILVATTVIEVGVDVPNASTIMIVNAERYGLAQLHQLRGRVGRSSAQGYCLLFDKSNNELSRERLKILQDTENGKILAQKDLELRGGGNFFGKEQSGKAGFKIFDYISDQDIVIEVMEKQTKDDECR